MKADSHSDLTVGFFQHLLAFVITHTITFAHTNQPNKLEISASMWTHSSLKNTTGQQHRQKISQSVTAGGESRKRSALNVRSHLVTLCLLMSHLHGDTSSLFLLVSGDVSRCLFSVRRDGKTNQMIHIRPQIPSVELTHSVSAHSSVQMYIQYVSNVSRANCDEKQRLLKVLINTINYLK